MPDATSFARLIDAVPYVENAAVRDARFPNPAANQRVQRGDAGQERYDGAQWRPDGTSYATGPLVRVKAQGAKGDGVTDDFAVLLAAVASAVAQGGVIYFEKPTAYYKTSQDILVGGSVRIIGDGPGTKIQNDTGNLGIFSLADGVSDVEIAYLNLASPPGAVNVLGRGLVSANLAATGAGVRRLSVHHCTLQCASTSGVVANQLIDSWIVDNYIDNAGTGEHGVYLSDSGGNSDSVVVARNRMTSSTTTGVRRAVQISGSTRMAVQQNIINGFAFGITFSSTNGTTDSQAIGNQIRGVGFDAIDCFNPTASGLLIANNAIYSPGRNGIRTDGGLTEGEIVGNRIRGAGASGMRLNNVTASTIAANHLRDCDSDANGAGGDDSSCIRLNAGNTGNTFVGNTCTTSNVGSFHKYAVSIANGQAGNRWRANRFDSGRTAIYDIGEDFGGLTFYGDAAVAVVALNNYFDDRPSIAYFNTPLTANRDYSINTAGVPVGTRWRLVRSANATGAFNLTLKTSGGSTIKALAAASTWCEAEWDGTNLLETANGTL